MTQGMASSKTNLNAARPSPSGVSMSDARALARCHGPNEPTCTRRTTVVPATCPALTQPLVLLAIL